jgi:DNA-binding response OmpR family regulator
LIRAKMIGSLVQTQKSHIERPHILLVEDAVDLASVIAHEFEVAGHRVTHVINGEAALALAEHDEFHLIVLDWMLPGMDGLEVLRRLRTVSPVPVLMLTARDAEIDRVLGLELGADDYLVKPFSMRELMARVRAMLRRREMIEQILHTDRQAQTDQTAFTVGDLTLDPVQHTAAIKGELLDLTRAEFALLHLLVSNAGRVFSRAYLLETLWGEQYIGGDRSVDNTVLRLRKKLKTMDDALETVWGIGYRWKRD